VEHQFFWWLPEVISFDRACGHVFDVDSPEVSSACSIFDQFTTPQAVSGGFEQVDTGAILP